jgi:Flp pilus assembly protein TadD
MKFHHCLSAAVVLLAFAGCRRPVAMPAAVDEPAALPASYGIYALDHGVLTPLQNDPWGSNPPEERLHRTFSGDVSLVIYQKWIGNSAYDPKSIWLCDWRTMDDAPRPKTHEVTAPVKNHPDMMLMTLPGGFQPGLYSVGMYKGDYRFGVETTDPEAFWKSALSEKENRWHAHEYLGSYDFTRGDTKGALEHWKRCVALRPSLYEVHNNYGIGLVALGRIDEALAEYKIAVDLDGQQAAVRMNYADAFRMARRYEEAITQYREVIRLNSGNAGAWLNLGVAAYDEGKVDEAEAAFKEALKIKPDYAVAKKNLDVLEKRKANAVTE